MDRKEFSELKKEAGFTNQSLADDLNKGIGTVKNWGGKGKTIPIEVIKYLKALVELKKFEESEKIEHYKKEYEWSKICHNICEHMYERLEKVVMFKNIEIMSLSKENDTLKAFLKDNNLYDNYKKTYNMDIESYIEILIKKHKLLDSMNEKQKKEFDKFLKEYQKPNIKNKISKIRIENEN